MSSGNVASQNQTAQPSVPPVTGSATGVIPQTNHASLYVGDLDAEVNEAQIYEKFGSIGQIMSIRVCRDMVTRKSLCYAYVNFQTHQDAEKAFESLNFEMLMDRPMRIMWSQRDPAIRKSGVGNVFIKNLDKKITPRDLFDTLSCFGKILSLKIAHDEKGNSKGYGFVHFALEESATKAIDTMNGMKIEDKQVVFCNFVPRKDRPNTGSDRKFNNVYVKNFGEDMTDDKMSEMFKEFGEIISAKVMVTQGDEPKSKGFGFCSFKNQEDAAKAVAALNNTTINNRTLYVGRAQKKSERLEVLRRQFESRPEKKPQYVTGINLYVKNLDDRVDDDQLHSEFARFGTITSCKVMTDQFGNSKGFGFVCYSNPEEAAMAVTEMSYKMINDKPIYVALAQKKEERRNQMTNMNRSTAMSRPAMNMNMMHNTAGGMIPFPAGGAGATPSGAPGNPAFFPQNAMPMNANQFNMFPQHFPSNMMQGNNPGNAAAAQQRNTMINAAAGYPNLATHQNMARMQQYIMQQQQVAARNMQQPKGPGNPPFNRDMMAQQQFNMAAQQMNRMQMPMGGSMQRQGGPNRMQQQQPRMPNMSQQVQAPQQPQTSSEPTDPLKTNNDDFIRQLNEMKNDAEKKQVIGEKLFHLLQDHVGSEYVGKITGMLLGYDERDLIDMILHPDSKLLFQRADEAKALVLQHRTTGNRPGAPGNAPGPAGDN